MPYGSLIGKKDRYYRMIVDRDIDNFFKLHRKMNDIPITLKESIFACLHPDPNLRI